MADSEGNALTWRHIGIFRILLRLLAVTVLVMALFALFILFQDLYLSRQQAEWAGGYEEALALRELGEKLRLVEQTASELERIWRNQGHWQAFAEAVFSEQPATNMVGSVEWHLRETSLQVPGQRAKVPMYYYFGQVGGYAPSDRPDELIPAEPLTSTVPAIVTASEARNHTTVLCGFRSKVTVTPSGMS